MIKNSFNDLYVGITVNLEKRLRTHNARQGALFTKRKSEFSLVFNEKYSTLALARKREIQIKKWRRNKKEILIEKFSKGIETKLI